MLFLNMCNLWSINSLHNSINKNVVLQENFPVHPLSIKYISTKIIIIIVSGENKIAWLKFRKFKD